MLLSKPLTDFVFSRTLSRRAGDNREIAAKIWESNRLLATVSGALLLFFALIEGCLSRFMWHNADQWAYWTFATLLSIGIPLTRLRGFALHLGQALIFFTADLWLLHEMLQPPISSGLVLGDYTVAMFILSLFRNMGPLEAVIYDLGVFAPFIIAQVQAGFDVGVFTSALLVLLGAFISQMRLYRTRPVTTAFPSEARIG